MLVCERWNLCFINVINHYLFLFICLPERVNPEQTTGVAGVGPKKGLVFAWFVLGLRRAWCLRGSCWARMRTQYTRHRENQQLDGGPIIDYRTYRLQKICDIITVIETNILLQICMHLGNRCMTGTQHPPFFKKQNPLVACLVAGAIILLANVSAPSVDLWM